MSKKGSIEEIQYCEEREIEWKIPDFPSIAEDEVIESATFSFAESSWYFRLVKKSISKPGFAAFGLYNTKPWKYSVKYDFGFRKLDGSVDQLSKGILKEDETMCREFVFKLP